MTDFDYYLDDIARVSKPRPGEDADELFRRLRSGDTSVRNRLVELNLPMVVSIVAGRNIPRRQWCEAISAGNEGLVKAVDCFDPDRDLQFSTFAYHYIRGYIVMGFDRKRTLVRVPAYAQERRWKLERLAAASGLDFDAACDKMGLSASDRETLDLVMNACQTRAGGWNRQEDFDPQLFFYEQEFVRDAIRREESDAVRDAMRCLHAKEAAFVRNYFFDDMTMKETGELHGVTRERVRQVLNKAKARMKPKLEVYAV